METIYDEIIEVAEGKVAVEDSVLRNAPHTVDVVSADEWDRAYTRTQAAFLVPSLRVNKYFTRWVVLTVPAVTVELRVRMPPDGGFRPWKHKERLTL